jgi:hypothetical protein
MKKYVPKFKIGQTVVIKDNCSSNPANDTVVITKIATIRINRGKGIFLGEDSSGIFYSLTHYSLLNVPEKKITAYRKGIHVDKIK